MRKPAYASKKACSAWLSLRNLVTNVRLGKSFIERARGRLPFLPLMRNAGLHADAPGALAPVRVMLSRSVIT
jgi:hypothetical protein